MKKYVFLAIITILGLKLNAQYVPYNFKDFEPEWVHHSYEEGLLDDDVQIYDLVQKMITDDYIYLLYSISDKIWYYNGFLLEKLDKSTGEMIWDYHSFERSFDNRDYPSHIFLRDDGKLVLSSFRQQPEENSKAVWVAANLNTWEFDDQTGDLVGTKVTDAADSNNTLLSMPIFIQFLNTTQTFISRTQNTINFIRSLYVSDSVRIQLFDLTVDGHSLKAATTSLPFKYPKVGVSTTIRVSENLILNYRESETFSRDSFNTEITLLDNDLNILHSKNLTDDFEDNYRGLVAYVGDSVFCVMQFGERIFPDKPYRYQKLITYDYEGNIVEQLDLNRGNGSALYSLSGFNVMYIEELEKTLLVSTSKDESGSYWEWFLSSEDGAYEQIGKTYIQNIEDMFRWRFINLVFMDYLGDGKILIHALHLNEGSNTTGTLIPSIAVISLDEVRKSVSVFNEEKNNDVFVYPNPAHNYLIVKEEYGNHSYEIYDLQGRVVHAQEPKTGRINISELPLGIYLIKIYDKNGIVGFQKIIKI